MNRLYGGVSVLRNIQMKSPVAITRLLLEQQDVILSAVSCPGHEATVRGKVTAGHLEDWIGLLEGFLLKLTGYLDWLWRRRPAPRPNTPPNNYVKQTVRSAAGCACAHAAVGRPAAYV